MNIKHLLHTPILLFTALAFTACSATDDEPTTPQPAAQRPMTFGSAIDEGESTTRAVVSASEYFDTLHISGVKTIGSTNQVVFPNYYVLYGENTAGTSATNTHGWEYVLSGTMKDKKVVNQSIKYWDTKATDYRFFGYAFNKNNDNATSWNRITPPNPQDGAATANMTIAAKVYFDNTDANVVKNLASTPYFAEYKVVPQDDFGSTVQLTFRHPFAKVRFILLDENGLDASESPVGSSLSKVKNPRFGPVSETSPFIVRGNIHFTYDLLGSDGASVEIRDTTKNSSEIRTLSWLYMPYVADDKGYFGNKTNLSSSLSRWEANKWHYIITMGSLCSNIRPGAHQLEINFDGMSRTATVPASYCQFEPGYEYTFVFKVSNDEAKFQPNLYVYTRWQSGTVIKDENNNPLLEW